MAMKINKPTSMCTLYEIRLLKETMAENASVHSYSVYIDGLYPGSVLVMLSIHPGCIEAVDAVVTSDFMAIHHLTNVFMNNRVGKALRYPWSRYFDLYCPSSFPTWSTSDTSVS